MHPRYVKSCRLCGSPHLTEIINLGKQYLRGCFIKEGVIDPPPRCRAQRTIFNVIDNMLALEMQP